MAIKIGGTSIIDDNKNIANVGIITVGIGGTSGQFKVGTGVTIDGAGNAYFDGYITVNGGINYLVGITSIYPQDDILPNSGIFDTWNGNLDLYFDSPVEVVSVGIGTTLTVELRKTSVVGNAIATAGISSINYPGGDFSVLRVSFGGSITNQSYDTFYPIIPKGIIQFSSTGTDYEGNYSGEPQQNTFSFNYGLGASYEGGYVICQSGGTNWIVAPSTTEVLRNWYGRVDACTLAISCTGCSGWFIPNSTQLSNPGYTCRVYWDSYQLSSYWSNSTSPEAPWIAYGTNFSTGAGFGACNLGTAYSRAFRCVTY